MSTTPVSTAAWAIHDLGLATIFGGSLFGKLALYPAVNQIDDRRQRGEVLDSAWGKFKFVHVASLAAVGLTWFVGRGLRSGREVGRHGRATVLAKDALVGGMLATGIGSMVCGILLTRERHRAVTAGPLTETPPRAAALERTVKLLGDATMLLAAGVQLTTCMLALQGSRSSRWTLSSRRLP